MASGNLYGTCSGTSGSKYTFRLRWTSTAQYDANSSSLTIRLYISRNDGYSNSAYNLDTKPTVVLKVDGVSIIPTIYHIDTREGNSCLFAEATTSVNHKDDGTLTVAVSASFSHSGSSSLTGGLLLGDITLDTIPRASTITSASNGTLGKACAVKWTPQAKTFRYKLKFSIGDFEEWTDPIHPNTTSAYTYTGYTLPLEVANQIPDSPTGTMKVTLYTYSNSAATTQVGSPSSKTITVTVPDNSSTKPTITMEIASANTLGDPFSSLYIQGKSKVKATTLTGLGQYSAKISSLKMYVNGVEYGSPYQSDYLSKSGTLTIRGRATDSRGFYNEAEQNINVIPYSKPLILPASGESAIICARCDENGYLSESGTHLKIKARRIYSNVMVDDEQNNFCAIRYRYREESTNTFSDWVTILEGSNTSTDTIDSDPISGVVSSAKTSYVVQVGVIDDIGESDAVQFIIPTDFVTVDIPEECKGRSIGIFRYAVPSEDGERRIDVDGFIHGGGIDNLTLGTMLTASSTAPLNLNDYIIPGTYYSPSAENSRNIVNTPYTEGGFGLEVRELQSKNYIRQTIYYGRTIGMRHWNNEEWSEWVRLLITDVGTGVCTDFVVEQGESGVWSYRKWASGYAECWGSSDAKRTFASQWGSLYVCEPTPAIEYPFEFAERPTETANLRTSTPACWLYADSSGKGLNTTTCSGVYSAVRPTEYTSEFTLYIDIMVKGRWK